MLHLWKEKVTSPRHSWASTKRRESNINSLVEITIECVCYTMFQLTNSWMTPLYITVSVNHIPLKMEIDTGATLTVISESIYKEVWTKEQAPPVQMTKTKLCTYSRSGNPSQRITTVDCSTREPTESTTSDCHRRTRTQLPGQKLATEVRLEGPHTRCRDLSHSQPFWMRMS